MFGCGAGMTPCKDIKWWLSRLLPWVVGVVLFSGVCYLFYAPQFEGMRLGQGDIVQYAGMSEDVHRHREIVGEDPQWTGSMFSGMPAYLIDVEYPTQDVKQSVGGIVKVVDGPMNMSLFAMLFMMLAVVMMGINPWIGIVAGLAYGLSTYFFLIIDAGHITKMWALVYAPPFVASVWYALRRDMWCGAALAALFGSLELGANHPQITYYFLLACVALWMSELVVALRGKGLKIFGRRTALLALAAILAVASNFSPLWYTYKHQRYTTRGVAEAMEAEDARSRKMEYNTQWSYGIAESFNMLVPNYMGAHSADFSEEAVAVLRSDGAQNGIFEAAVDDLVVLLREYYPEVRRGDVERMINAGDSELLDKIYALYEVRMNEASGYVSNYWGSQPYTAGPTYLGAAFIFLALVGAMMLTARNRWWVVVVSLFALLLAWGSNIMGFYELMFDYLPGYKSFRTVSMALVVVEWSVPLLAAVALAKLLHSELSTRALLIRIVSALAVCLFAIVTMMLTADYGLADIHERLGDALWVEQLERAVFTARRDAAMDDAMRSAGYVVLTAVILMLYVVTRGRKAEPTLQRRVLLTSMLALAAIVAVVDIVGIDRRYMGEEKWQPAREEVIVATAADREIMLDTELGYRVYDIDNRGTAVASYHHRSVDGYHGAKLGRYDEVLHRYIYAEEPAVLAMLNTRYIIEGGEVWMPEEEPYGAAWFVEDVVRCATAAEELDALGHESLATTAVVGNDAPLSQSYYDASGSIKLVSYAPNRLIYEYSAPSEVLCIFSEIYFPEGWTLYVDGRESEYFSADYILRAAELPAGKHTVEWRFRAPHWGAATAVTGVASWLILAWCVGVLFLPVWRRWREKLNNK